MRKIRPSEITNDLTQEQLEILAEMLEGDSANNGWIECHNKLSDEQVFQVHNKLGELIRKREELRIAALSERECLEEEKKSKEWYENADSDGFYGNMGQPETAQEFKKRYGVWPPGFDKNGDKLEND
ncbi:MAG: hypothetical protein OIF50_08915 [Flavobacteriaceae bacterium]|nr:hypothetical protein [Flavobacteriaceae bacterium]